MVLDRTLSPEEMDICQTLHPLVNEHGVTMMQDTLWTNERYRNSISDTDTPQPAEDNAKSFGR